MTADREVLDKAYADTLDIYTRKAAGWDAHRVRVFFEKPWLDRWLGDAPAGLSVLDLGCGSGDPIGAYLIKKRGKKMEKRTTEQRKREEGT